MSCDVLQDALNCHRHCVKDDIESCLWSLFAWTLYYFLPRHPLWDFGMFRENFMRAEEQCGGHKKMEFLLKRNALQHLDLPCEPLKDLLNRFRILLGEYYVANDKPRSDTANAQMMVGISKLTAVIYRYLSNSSGSRVVMVDTHIERYSALAL